MYERYMRFWVALLGCLLAFFPIKVNAQKKGSFSYLTASTDKYLGKKVTIFISDITLPERNAGLGDNFKVYLVDTCSPDGSDVALGLVKVAKEKAESFVKRYKQSSSKFSPKNAEGIFKERDFDDNYQVSVPYYLDMTGN
jgi:hypothetical protein